MFRSLFKLAALLVAGILIYNYFFGTGEEKANSKKIFGEMRDVVVSVGNLVKAEKQKFDAGKYDGALEKLGGAYRAVRERAQHVDEKVLKRLDELEQRKAQLEKELDEIESADQQAAPTPKKGLKRDPKAEQAVAAKEQDQQRRKEKLQRELENLFRDSENLLQQAQQE